MAHSRRRESVRSPRRDAGKGGFAPPRRADSAIDGERATALCWRMQTVLKFGQLGVIVAGMVTIVVIDTLAALASKYLGFKYKWAMVGSVALYVATGWFAQLSSPTASPGMAAAMVGVAESTLGWAIAWRLGPGKSPTEKHMVAQVVVAVFGGALIAAAVGWMAGWGARHWG